MGSLDNKSITAIIERADKLYARREDIENVRTSVALLRTFDGPDSYEVAWRLSRALFFLGQEEREAALQLHKQGVVAGEQAVRNAPKRVEGHFWIGVNLALLARVEPRIRAVTTALQAKRALESAIRIDSTYHAAGPLRVLARLQQRLPRLLGGGQARAQLNYERAIALASSNTVTRLYFAELLFELGEIDRAHEQLEMVRLTPLDPEWAFEIKRDQRLAREMLARM